MLEELDARRLDEFGDVGGALVRDLFEGLGDALRESDHAAGLVLPASGFLLAHGCHGRIHRVLPQALIAMLSAYWILFDTEDSILVY